MLGEDCSICCTFDNGVNIETVSCKKQMKLWSDWKRLTSESFHVCWNFLKCFWSLKCIYAQWIHHMVKDNVLKKCCHKFQKKTCFSLTLFQFNILLLHCGTFISVINFQSGRKYLSSVQWDSHVNSTDFLYCQLRNMSWARGGWYCRVLSSANRAGPEVRKLCFHKYAFSNIG